MGKVGCEVLVLLAAGVCCRLHYHSLASFILGFAFDSALAFLAYQRSAEIYWSSLGRFPCWLADGFAVGRVYALEEAVDPSRKRDAGGALGVKKFFPARDVI